MIRKVLALASVALLGLPVIAMAGERQFADAAAGTEYCVGKVTHVRSSKGSIQSKAVKASCSQDMNGRSAQEIAEGVRGGNDSADQGGIGRSSGGHRNIKAFH